MYPPEDFINFRLGAEGDERLTQWMQAHLALTLWTAPVPGVELIDVEVAVVEHQDPPLNISNADSSRHELRRHRQALADQARAWALAADS